MATSRLSSDTQQLLYISTWDVFGSLGKALVNPLLDELRALGWSITTAYLADSDDDRPGPSDIRVKRRSRYGKVAELADAWRSWRPVMRRSSLVLVRGYEAGLFALLVARVGGSPYVFHAEGFWAEERQVARSFAPSVNRVLARLEWAVMARAEGLVVLTSRAAAEVRERLPGKPVLVVPSSIDAERFARAAEIRGAHPRTSVLRCCWLGSFGGRYDHLAAIRFLRALSQEAAVELTVVSADIPDEVRRALDGVGVPVHYTSARLEEVADLLAKFDVGLLFMKTDLANRGASPTKFAEYLAAGVPVAMSPDIGDCDEILDAEHTGVVVDPAHLDDAAAQLVGLVRDPGLAQRCIEAARRHCDARVAARELDRFLAERLACNRSQ